MLAGTSPPLPARSRCGGGSAGRCEEVLRPKARGGREELPGDFIWLVIAFAGRLYGMRSAAVRRRLLAASGRCRPGGGR
jgi:hypothetical protein